MAGPDVQGSCKERGVLISIFISDDLLCSLLLYIR